MLSNNSILIIEHDCIVKPFIIMYSNWGNRLHLAEEGLLERLKPVLQKKNDKQSLLQKFAQVWECPITSFDHRGHVEYNNELHNGKSNTRWRYGIYVGRDCIRFYGLLDLQLFMETNTNGDRDILTLPKVSSGHKGDEMELSSDGRECFVLEIPFASYDQDRRKMAEDFYKLL
ncbi:unnamed protein product [Rhizophagus irregularis]|uniref:Uncharacterized protein n=2 Tax=Rhizophagus irregularis TaxID=588596 RepID=A0A915ZFF2_9GLOM|nr:unnamed protein product [Rhizophagus irregularis]CAB5373035.1 unnamed protein product [Rhizophagus irregularis]